MRVWTERGRGNADTGCESGEEEMDRCRSFEKEAVVQEAQCSTPSQSGENQDGMGERIERLFTVRQIDMNTNIGLSEPRLDGRGVCGGEA